MPGSRFACAPMAPVLATILTACTPTRVTEPPKPSSQLPSHQVVEPSRQIAADEREVRDLLVDSDISELSRRDREQGERLFHAVDRLGRATGWSSLQTLFAVVLASSGDLHLQRAALFSLVRRAPASLEVARQLLEADVPTLSTLAHFDPKLTREHRRAYERGLAAAVLGTSGLFTARAPLLARLPNAADASEHLVLTVALARLERREDHTVLLRDALANTPMGTQVTGPAAWGIAQLVPAAADLFFPCSFEIMRLGSPPLAVEVLALAAEERADEDLAPSILDLAERVAASNEGAWTSLMSSAGNLAAPPLLALVSDELRRHRSAEWMNDWVSELSRAYSRCGEDSACHFRALSATSIDFSHYKSAMFIAAHAGPDQGPELLALMESMARPYWLALAVDQRLSHPSQDQIVRIRQLTRRSSVQPELWAPNSACDRFDSPMEELIVRLETRANFAR